MINFSGQVGGAVLSGSVPNTFTGNVEISGSNQYLILAKANGATAILGDISISHNSRLEIWKSNQIADTLVVRMFNSELVFSGFLRDVSDKFHQLVVTGNSRIHFGHNHNKASKKTLVLDDLLINEGATLYVLEWEDGQDKILVRKDSTHLDAALKRIDFVGYDRRRIGKRNYNKDYWEIYAVLPEPSAYGAALSGVGLGLVCWSRRRDGKGHKEAGGHFH